MHAGQARTVTEIAYLSSDHLDKIRKSLSMAPSVKLLASCRYSESL